MKREVFDEQLVRFQEESHRDGRFIVNAADSKPCLDDDSTEHGGYCPIYLLHTGWAARALASSRPVEHVDIGGLTYFAGIASALVPSFRYYDYRTINIPLPGLSTGRADLTNLPFKTGELKSLSCMHVMEHIGLGRYGDPLDINGDLKAAAELRRVVAPGGQFLFVAPVGHPKIAFNAHRIYSYKQVIDMFPGMVLKEFTLIDLPRMIYHADPELVKHLSEGCGCFWFVKECEF